MIWKFLMLILIWTLELGFIGDMGVASVTSLCFILLAIFQQRGVVWAPASGMGFRQLYLVCGPWQMGAVHQQMGP